MRQGRSVNDIGQAALHQYDVSRFNGDISTGADSSSHVCPDERRSVVDAVANHKNFLTLCL